MYNQYKLYIKNIAHILLVHAKNKEKKKLNKEKKKDTIYINNIDNNIGNEFIFNSFQNDKYKLLFLIKNELIFVGTFQKSCSTQYQRFLLLHIFISLNNFKGDLQNANKNFNQYEEYNNDNFSHLKSFCKPNSNLSSKEFNDILEILIFEQFFLKAIIKHFLQVFYQIFKKEDFNLKQTKLKNLYIIDINKSQILLDMNKIQGMKTSQKNKKFYKFNKLYEEILFQSKNMYNNYYKEYNYKYTNADSDFRFVKFECTSTYPRLLFIIRFIPVLKGLSIIHVYSQKKLSRNNDNNIQLEQGINCKEVDFIFGSFMKDNKNFEFKYGAPKKLEYIEKFIEEFYLTGRSNLNIFRINNQNKKYKYVNYDIINNINSYQISKTMTLEEIFTEFTNKLTQEYEKYKKKKEEELEKELLYDNESNISLNTKNHTKNIEQILSLNKQSFYNILFDIKPEEKILKDISIKSIHLVTDKDYISNKSNNNINQNLNINNEMNANSERKNLIGDSISLSVSKEKINGIFKNKNQNYDNFSMISEVKIKEKFEVKVLNIKNKREEDKEVTDDKINESSLLQKEKDPNINDLLELISSTSTSNKKLNGFKRIKENSKEDETNHLEINKKISKLSLIDKDNNESK